MWGPQTPHLSTPPGWQGFTPAQALATCQSQTFMPPTQIFHSRDDYAKAVAVVTNMGDQAAVAPCLVSNRGHVTHKADSPLETVLQLP